jgi:hypothetical protein
MQDIAVVNLIQWDVRGESERIHCARTHFICRTAALLGFLDLADAVAAAALKVVAATRGFEQFMF